MNATIMQQSALELAGEQFRIFPVAAGRKFPPVKDWQQWATCDGEKVRTHWSVSPQDNVGIACGGGLLVLDVDGDAGKQSLAALEAAHGALPDTCKVATPSGGLHLYFTGPDVSNSVRKLGAGLDIRSRGGYVLAPGSTVNGKPYTVAVAADPAPAPEWLVDLCSKPGEKSKAGEAVQDAAPSVVDRAREWLAKQAPAIEGQGGDAHTFTVACGLRDQGVSDAQAIELIVEWNATCSPPWSMHDLQAKVRNAYAYAQNEPGSKVATAEDFPVMPETREAIDKAARVPENYQSKLRTPSEIDAATILSNNYIVKGWVDRRAEVMLYGQWNAGKSFVVLDLLASISLGLPWFGARVRKSRVLYLAYEGHAGMSRRVVALRGKYPDLDAAPFAWWPMSHAMTSDKGRKEVEDALRDFAQGFGGAPDIVAIDPLRNALGGSDSDPDLVEKLRAQTRALIRSGCAVLLVHHVGHGNKDRERGDSGLPAGADSSIRIDTPDREGGPSAIVATKQRDSIKGTVHFRLNVVDLGVDGDGDPVTTCTVEVAQPGNAELVAPGPGLDETFAKAKQTVLRYLWREIKAGADHTERSLTRAHVQYGLTRSMADAAISDLEVRKQIERQGVPGKGGRHYRYAIVGDMPEEGAAGMF